MIFAEFALDAALGTVAAHTHRLPGRVIHKGAVLDAAALAALRAAGRQAIVAARLEPGDVAEDQAAERVARVLLAPGLSAGRAGTGRVNLHADAPGLLRIDAARVDAINAVDEAVTVATLPDYAAVGAGDMVATIKVIPFAVASGVLDAVEANAHSGGSLLGLHPFRPFRVGLVLSELPGMKNSVIEGTIEAMGARVAGLGGSMLPPVRCAHETAAIAGHLARLEADGATLLLVAGASATVDRRDVGPAAIVAAGGQIEHFGMPVDPGNLICLGRIGAIQALVLPGCARSPKANGIDWVLQRLFAGLAVDAAAIMRMGVGGLLKEFAGRPLPRARAAAAAPETPKSAAVAAIVLAAGQSTRMAPHSKLLVAGPDGRSMIARVVDNLLSSRARPVLVVVGHREAEIRAALAGRPVAFVPAPGHAEGLSASLRAGIAAVPPDSAAALVCLGDMPLVTGRVIDHLIAAWDPDEGRAIVQPTHRGGVGNPLLWDRRFFAELLALSGDSGGRQLLARHQDELARVEVDDDSVLRDFDTVDSLESLPERLRPPSLAAMRAG